MCNVESMVKQLQPTSVYKEPALIFEQSSIRIIKTKHENIGISHLIQDLDNRS